MKFVTYENKEAMEKYQQMVEHKYSTSVLCNGKELKEYGLKRLYDVCTITAQKDYEKIASHLHIDPINKFELINIWRKKEIRNMIKNAIHSDTGRICLCVYEKISLPTIQIAIEFYTNLIKIMKYRKADKCVSYYLDRLLLFLLCL